MTDDMMQLAMAAPVVVAQRMMRMALAGTSPSASDRKEMKRMSAEKVAALTESWNNTATQMTRAYIGLSFDVMRLAWSPLYRKGSSVNTAVERFSNAATTSMQKSLGPIRRRAVANSKRLGRKGRS
ncbi:kynureninase [Methylohalomonas lacus]|uniref:Kynureninase n=1 Tax=Methylohalomonas lacus TaxID=398773 RepID=A0AAE3L162_9GAMM|nr:polyhydroxyalkanoate granule-associated phasin [Methylohalomonas lacus]MCS3903130.1 kynureninase [Methylohalomonas lacus]